MGVVIVTSDAYARSVKIGRSSEQMWRLTLVMMIDAV